MAPYCETLNNTEMFFLFLSLKIGTGEVRRSYSGATQSCLLPNANYHSFSTGGKLSDFLW